MKIKLNSVAGFLAAASLLSGSAFAFAPEFNNVQFPTVIITDRTTGPAPSQFDDPITGPSSSYTFRYDDAIDLGNYIDPADYGSAATLSDVKVTFNEFDSSSDLTVNTVKTLEINGVEGLDDLPVKADFSGANAFDAGSLSFRNIDFSPGASGPYDNIGDNTGDDIDTSDQVRRVVVYIDTVDSTVPAGGSRGMKSLDVITHKSADDTDFDRTTTPTSSDPFVLELSDPGNFNGWVTAATDRKILNILDGQTQADGSNQPAPPNGGPVSANLAGFTPLPSVTLPPTTTSPNVAVPSGTTTIGMTSNASQVGLSGWQREASASPALALTAGNVYRLTLDVDSTTAAPGASIYMRFGNALTTGQTSYVYNAVAGLTDGTTRKLPILGESVDGPIDVYLAPKADGNGAIDVSIIDSSTTGGTNFTLSGYEVSSSSRTDLMAGATVVHNAGGTVPTLAAGEGPAAPATGLVGIAAPIASGGAVTPGTSSTVDSTGLNDQLPSSVTVSGNKVLFQTGASPSNNANYLEFVSWAYAAQDQFLVETEDFGFPLEQDSIYVMDIYASINTANVQAPSLVAATAVDVGAACYTVWGFLAGSPDPNLNNPAVAYSTAPRVYTSIVNPALSGNAVPQGGFGVYLLHSFNAVLANTTVTVHRIVVSRVQL